MKNEIYDNMLSAHDVSTEQQRRNAIFEVNQQVIFAGLYNGGFFDVAAFYGGTCLRIFHGLQRFSEDMDFSLLAPDDKFDFTKYFHPVIDEFAIVGREVDTQPPLNFKTEQKLLLQPHSFMARCYTLPVLFAGKMHALVYRGWKNRVKGRDWYDFEWYVRHNVPLDFAHLAERVRQFNDEEIGRTQFMDQLKDRLAAADINQVKSDVLPFIRDPKELDIWSNDYFVRLADMMKFE